MCDLSVIIPVHNDEKNLKKLYTHLERELLNLTSNYEIVFVENGSKDATFNLLSQIRDSNDRVKLLKLSSYFGIPKAITAGMEHSCGDVIAIMDAGMSYLPKDITALLEPIQAYDVPMTVGNLIPCKRAYSKFLYKTKKIYSSLTGKSYTSLDNPGIFRAITRTAYNSVKDNSKLTGTVFCRIKKARIDYVTIDIIRNVPGSAIMQKFKLVVAELIANASWITQKDKHNPNYKIDKIIW